MEELEKKVQELELKVGKHRAECSGANLARSPFVTTPLSAWASAGQPGPPVPPRSEPR
jgi:hypothetical protein